MYFVLRVRNNLFALSGIFSRAVHELYGTFRSGEGIELYFQRKQNSVKTLEARVSALNST